ncbi:MAG: LysR family transcriptional regulator [Alphaproteobacteria bacterium]|nr:LysR family transcriptional regulator [Alphaproteobacteria bacterium]
MSRLETNRAGEMEVFVRVVELSGFSAAARALRLSPSAVSKLIGRLEARLGARLLNRSTRNLQLTPEGAAFYARCVRILADMADAEQEAGSGTAPRGRLRVNSNVAFGTLFLLPLVPAFQALYPEVVLDIALTDQVIDLLEQRADVAIRVGPMPDSRLVARKLATSHVTLVAAPAYLAQHGTPQTLADLARHRRIGFNFARSFEGWPFREESSEGGLEGGGDIVYPVDATLLAGDGETARHLALAGCGLARLGHFQLAPDIAAGRLVPVLEHLNPGDTEDIHAVYIGQGGPLPARVRAFIDFLGERVDRILEQK